MNYEINWINEELFDGIREELENKVSNNTITLADYHFDEKEKTHIINMYSPYPEMSTLIHEIAHCIQHINDPKSIIHKKYKIVYAETFNLVKETNYFKDADKHFSKNMDGYMSWRQEMEATCFSYDVILNTLFCLREVLLSKYSLKNWIFKVKDMLGFSNEDYLGSIIFNSITLIAREYKLILTEDIKDGIAYFIHEYFTKKFGKSGKFRFFGVENICTPRIIRSIDELKYLDNELFDYETEYFNKIMDNYFLEGEQPCI